MKYMVDINGQLPESGALSKAKRLQLLYYAQALTDDICDNYCKWPALCKTEDELFEHCDKCPL